MGLASCNGTIQLAGVRRREKGSVLLSNGTDNDV